MTEPPPQYPPSPQSAPPQPLPVAGWGPRIAARLIDAAVAAVPVFLIGAIGGLLGAGMASIGQGDPDVAFGIVSAVFAFLACIAYETFAVMRWRATLGKRAMGLQVAPLSGGGHQGPIPVMASAARAALLWSPVIFAFNFWAFASLAVVAAAVFGLTARRDAFKRQGLHDRTAGTVVLTGSPTA